MEKWKKVLLVVGGLLVVGLAGAFVYLKTQKPVSISFPDFGEGRASTLYTPVLTILAPTTTVDNKIYTAGHKNILCSLDFASATATIKFAGSLSETPPNFNAAQSSTNQYTYLSFTDLRTNSSVDGLTGLAVTNSTSAFAVSINTSLMTWVSVTNTVAASGRSYVQCKLGDNQ